MNVLILTPDRVGSTLLQRVLTVFMNFHEFDKPVINLHELTNGLIKYYSSRFHREVLGKPNTHHWGYFQTLKNIVDLLANTDHYKTSRLAHYHIINRGDSRADQVRFYQYLNDNFFIISAQRKNLLEHALSWIIANHSKKLNVFSHSEKIHTFASMYKNKIQVDYESLITYLNAYKKYLGWVQDHFSVGSYFHYERDMVDIENYVLNLPVFNDQRRRNWAENFGIEFSDWNRCHYLTSDISGLGRRLSNQSAPTLSLKFGPSASRSAMTDIFDNLSPQDQQFVTGVQSKYAAIHEAIDELVEHKVLVTHIPIKLQTFLEKQLVVKNFDQCVLWYNHWQAMNGVGQPYTDELGAAVVQKEINQWHDLPSLQFGLQSIAQ